MPNFIQPLKHFFLRVGGAWIRRISQKLLLSQKSGSVERVQWGDQMLLYGLLLGAWGGRHREIDRQSDGKQKERVWVREACHALQSTQHEIYLATVRWWSKYKRPPTPVSWPPTHLNFWDWTQLSLLNLSADRRDEMLLGEHTCTNKPANTHMLIFR